VLLAGATSLPELATGTSAVVVVGDVNLAAGGVLQQ
jgi:Ca2+/Na+ antiporter